MKQTELCIKKTAKICSIGNEKAPIRIIALHGYGQLAQFFIRWFNCLDLDKYEIIAPEGLHRFYLNGTSGRVGASWMTKEERETDIEDYIRYLNQIPEAEDKFTVLIGFSQGAATASRWYYNTSKKIDQLVLWGGVFPNDINYSNTRKTENNNPPILLFGNNDQYYSVEKIDTIISSSRERFGDVKFECYEGVHKIEALPLIKLMSDIENI